MGAVAPVNDTTTCYPHTDLEPVHYLRVLTCKEYAGLLCICTGSEAAGGQRPCLLGCVQCADPTCCVQGESRREMSNICSKCTMCQVQQLLPHFTDTQVVWPKPEKVMGTRLWTQSLYQNPDAGLSQQPVSVNSAPWHNAWHWSVRCKTTGGCLN